jgi:hypothetical protein
LVQRFFVATTVAGKQFGDVLRVSGHYIEG